MDNDDELTKPVAAPAPWPNKKALMIGAAFLAVALLATLLFWKTRRETINGVVFVKDDPHPTGPCVATGSYADINDGTVVVTNASGKIIATTRIGAGKTLTQHTDEVIALVQYKPTYTGYEYGCVFEFSVDVPRSDFYGLEINQRRSVRYSKSELEHDHWKVALQIGD